MRPRDQAPGLLLLGALAFWLAVLSALFALDRVAIAHQDEEIHRLQEQQRYASRELEHHLEETHVYDH